MVWALDDGAGLVERLDCVPGVLVDHWWDIVGDCGAAVAQFATIDAVFEKCGVGIDCTEEFCGVLDVAVA